MHVTKAILALLLGVYFCQAEIKKIGGGSAEEEEEEEKTNRWDETHERFHENILLIFKSYLASNYCIASTVLNVQGVPSACGLGLVDSWVDLDFGCSTILPSCSVSTEIPSAHAESGR